MVVAVVEKVKVSWVGFGDRVWYVYYVEEA